MLFTSANMLKVWIQVTSLLLAHRNTFLSFWDLLCCVFVLNCVLHDMIKLWVAVTSCDFESLCPWTHSDWMVVSPQELEMRKAGLTPATDHSVGRADGKKSIKPSVWISFTWTWHFFVFPFLRTLSPPELPTCWEMWAPNNQSRHAWKQQAVPLTGGSVWGRATGGKPHRPGPTSSVKYNIPVWGFEPQETRGTQVRKHWNFVPLHRYLFSFLSHVLQNLSKINTHLAYQPLGLLIWKFSHKINSRELSFKSRQTEQGQLG